MMKSFALEAYSLYSSQSQETRYRDLVTRYNALAESLATVRLAPGYHLPIQPHSLHCESHTNSVTGMTEMDCQ